MLWGGLLGIALMVLELLKMVSRHINYSFTAIYDILLIILIIAILIVATKQYRDTIPTKIISFPKAFGVGAVVSIVSFILFFTYLILHFQFIDTKGIERINQQNKLLHIQKIEKDTIRQVEIDSFFYFAEGSMDKQTVKYCVTHSPTDSVSIYAAMDSVKAFYYLRIVKPIHKTDTANYSLKNFLPFAKRTLWDVADLPTILQSISDTTADAVQQIIAATQNDFSDWSAVTQRLNTNKDKIPHYDNVLTIAFVSAFLVFCYTIFLNIFTALYLYKRKDFEPPKET